MSASYDELNLANENLAKCLRADIALPMLLPTYTGAPEQSARREAVAQALTRVFRCDEQRIEAGVICASPETLAAASRLNCAKDAFKLTVDDIRDEIKRSYPGLGQNLRLDHLLDRALAREKEASRTSEFDALLHNLDFRNFDLSRLDLLACYTRVRILVPNLKSISWTWARTRYSGERVSYKEAIELANALNETERQEALAALARHPQSASFMQVKSLPKAQLRANLVYRSDHGDWRESVSIAGPVLTPDLMLPVHVWRDKPDDNQKPARLKRSDARVSERPFIESLKLHYYLNEY